MLRVSVSTATTAGAIAIIELHGPVEPALTALTGRDESWPHAAVRLRSLAGIDEGLVARLDAKTAWIMPHGGTAVVRSLLRTLSNSGAWIDGDPAPAPSFPEAAGDPWLATCLDALASAASPLAGPLLLAQPDRWRRSPAPSAAEWTPEDAARSARLDRLLTPPTVVICGPPNVGKSTLANALAGRTVSIVADVPGTTRDATRTRLDLAGLVVDWHDAPGLRATDDPIERAAIDRIRPLIARADLLVAATDAASDWPDLPRTADLRVALRHDLGPRDDADLAIRITPDGPDGIDTFAEAVRDRLVPPADRASERPWNVAGRLRPIGTQNPIDEMPQST